VNLRLSNSLLEDEGEFDFLKLGCRRGIPGNLDLACPERGSNIFLETPDGCEQFSKPGYQP
jgi:hypothetical protein